LWWDRLSREQQTLDCEAAAAGLSFGWRLHGLLLQPIVQTFRQSKNGEEREISEEVTTHESQH